jgi:hypothetical protein
MSLSGKDHPNFKHGNCSLAFRKQVAEGAVLVKYLESLAIGLGMIAPKRRKRNTMF